MMEHVEHVVRWVITESDDWGGWSDGGGDAALFKTFIRPFIDVVDTAASVAETALSKTQLLTNIAVYGILDMLMPWVKPEYEAMVKDEQRRMSEIAQRHAATFARTEQALTEVGGNYDGVGVFFALFPGAVIAKNVAKVAAGGSAPAVKITVDSAFDFLDAVTFGATGAVTDALRRKFNISESLIYESDDITFAQAVSSVFRAQKVQMLLWKSKPIALMRDDGLTALKELLKDAVKPINELRDVNSIRELEQLTGHRFNMRQAVQRHEDKNNDVESIDRRDVDAVIDDVLPSLIEKAADPFIKRLVSLRSGLNALSKQYGVSDHELMRQVNELFEETMRELDA